MPQPIRQKKITFKMSDPLDFERAEKASKITIVFMLLGAYSFLQNTANIVLFGFGWYRLVLALLGLVCFFLMISIRHSEKNDEGNKMI